MDRLFQKHHAQENILTLQDSLVSSLKLEHAVITQKYNL